MTDSQPTATPIAEGIVARAARALGYVVTGNAGGWFGPLNPPAAQAPADVAGRQFDFPSGYNLVTRPRARARHGGEGRSAHRRDIRAARLSRRRPSVDDVAAPGARRPAGDRRARALSPPHARRQALRARAARRRHHQARHRRLGPHAAASRARLSTGAQGPAGGRLHDRRAPLRAAEPARAQGVRLRSRRAGADDGQHRAAPADLDAAILYGRQHPGSFDRRARRLDAGSDPSVPRLLGQPARRQHYSAARALGLIGARFRIPRESFSPKLADSNPY